MYLHNSFTNKICHTSSFLKQIYFNLIIQPEELIGKMTFYILSAILHYSVTSEWVKCLKSVCRLFKEVMWSFTVHFKKLFKIDIHSRKDVAWPSIAKKTCNKHTSLHSTFCLKKTWSGHTCRSCIASRGREYIYMQEVSSQHYRVINHQKRLS